VLFVLLSLASIFSKLEYLNYLVEHIWKIFFRVRFLRYMYNRESGIHITKYIRFPSLTSVKDNFKIYNKLMLFKTLPKRTRRMFFELTNFKMTFRKRNS
jgi:hypothetical protein